MKYKILSIIPLMLLLVSCTLTANLTPDQRYYSAIRIYNDNVEEYLAAYDVASLTTQTRWKAEIDPIIRFANQALTTWGDNLYGLSADSKEQAWLIAKRELITALVLYGVIEEVE